MKKKLFAASCLVVALGLMCFTSTGDRYFEIAKNLDIFSSLFKEVNTLYVDEVNPTKLMRVGIDAMLNSLDPYTNYNSEDEVEDYKTLHTGEYSGIGALTTEFNHRTVITMIYRGYPAFQNGLKIGDEIISVNGLPISSRSEDEIKQVMSGQEGTLVRLSVKRFGIEKPINLEFKRETIKRNNVPYFGMVTSDVGYIQLMEFTLEAAREVKNAVINLKQQGAKSIILDLRGNPGGLLEEAVNICNVFVPKGKNVVTMRGKIPENTRVYETLNPPVDNEIPLAIIINHGSASASEIVAGTIQDYDRGVIVGEKSFGKGLVQSPRALSYNSQVKITIAKYYTPTGRCIQVLDYSHRKDDGTVSSIPDSLRKEFKTSHGRSVYDIGGIDPDIKVEATPPSAITQVIHAGGFIFDYASVYVFQHPTIGPPKTFALTDKEYADFVTWIKDKPYNYKSSVELQLSALADEARRERTYDDVKTQFDQLKTYLTTGKKNELMAFKDQIKMLLEREIAARYYLEQGAVETSFKYDDELRKAIDVLNDQPRYRKILHLE